MPRIDNEVLLMLRAEDRGFVAGLQRASRALEELQKSLSDLARSRGTNPLKETDEYAKGLTRTIRETIPAVRSLLEAISDQRKISGAVHAYKNLADTFEEVARRHGIAARQLRRQLAQQEQELNEFMNVQKQLSALNREQASLMRERRELRGRTDEEAARRLQDVNRRLEEIRRSPVRSVVRELAEDIRPVARSIKELKTQLGNVEAQYMRNYTLAKTIEKTALASDKGVAAARNELAAVNTLNRLERQRLQALDERIKKAKIAAEAARQQQREEIKAALAQEAYNRAVKNFSRASISQKTGVFLQALAAVIQRASSAYGALSTAAALFSRQQLTVHSAVSETQKKMGGLAGAIHQVGSAMRGNAQQSMALSQGLTRVAISLGLMISAIKAATRITGLLISAFARLSATMFRVGAWAAQSMYNGLKLIIGLSGRFVSSMGNMLRAIAAKTAALLNAARAAKRYSQESMSIADATGWHSRSLKGLVGNVVNLNRWINTLGSSVRQIGQAFQNAGMTFSIFLSYPVGRTLGGWLNTALEFDKALIEVRKNADLLIDSTDQNIYTLQNLKQELLDLAQKTPTPLVDLGKMAVDAARLGLPPEFIQPFVEIMDQLVVATNLTADDAVKSVGRIMNIFYDLSSAGMQDVGAFEKAVRGLASSINELGQSNPVGENEIVAALLRMAPAAAALGMDLPMAVGLAASVASASATAERAGTQLNNALTQMVAKLQKVASAAGVTQNIFSDIVNQDPGEAFLGIVNAIAQIPDAVQRAKVANALFGLVGGKATNALGAAFEKVIENVALSQVAFEDATSVALEFERALDAVSNQIGLFKNQLSVIGVAIGDAVLPVITQILAYAVPVFQALAKLFQQLDDKTKLWIVGIGMLIAVIGPLAFAFGSLLFSVGILTTGLTGLFNVFGNLLKLPLKLAGALLLLVAPFGLIKTAVVAAIVYLMFFGNTLNTVVDWISEIASNMYAWGYNMFISFAEGIYAAAEFVIQAVYDTLSAIAAMLRSFSPPREGPLKDIDKWGQNIATTFANAFALADLSGITVFGEKINAALESTIRGLDTVALSVFDSLWSTISRLIALVEKDEKKGLSAFVNLLSVLQNGIGDVNGAFNALRDQLGAFATDAIELIKLQVLYNLEVEKSKKIKQELESIDEKTREQIRSIAADESLSVSARIAKIRAVKASAISEKQSLETQLKLSEQQQESIKELIEIQKQYIEIFKEFYKEEGGRVGRGRTGRVGRDDDDKIKDTKEKIDELQGALDKFDVEGIREKIKTASNSIQDSFKKGLEDGGRFVKRMNEARVSVAAFIDALLGKPINQEELEAYGQAYEDAYNKGKAWRDGIIQWVKDLEQSTQPVRDFLEAVRLLLLVFTAGYTGKDADQALSKDDAQKAKTVLGEYLAVVQGLGAGLRVLIDRTREYVEYLSRLFSGQEGGVFGKVVQALVEFGVAFAKAFGEGNPGISNLKNILAPIKSIVDSLVILAGLVFDNLGVLGEFLGNAAKYIIMMAGYVGVVLEFFKLLAGFGDKENLKKNLELTGNEWLKNLFNLDGLDDKNFSQQLIDLLVGWIQKADFTQVGEALGQKIQEALFGTKNLKTGEFSGGLFGNIAGLFDSEAVVQFLNNLVAALAGLVSSIDLQPLITALASLIETLFVVLSNSDAVNRLGEWLGVLIGQVVQAIPFEQLSIAFAVLANGIILALKKAVDDGSVQVAAKDLVNAIINALININWADLADTLQKFVKTFIGELSKIDFAKLGTVLSDFVSAIISALTDVLGDTQTYKNIGAIFGGLAGAIVKGLSAVDWGQHFTPSSLLNFVDAFIEGVTEAFKLASKPDYLVRAEEREKASLSPEQLKEIENLQKRFESLGKAADAFSGLADIANSAIDEMEQIHARLKELDADPERLQVMRRTIDETKERVNKSQADIEQIFTGIGETLTSGAERFKENGKLFRDAVDSLINFILEPFIPKPAKGAGKEDAGKGEEFSIYGPQIRAVEGQVGDGIIGVLNQLIADIKKWIEDNQATLNELGALIFEQILQGLADFAKEHGAEYFVALPLRFHTWVEEIIQPLQLLGESFGTHILTGLSIYFRDNAASAYSTLLFQFVLWLDTNFGVLQGYGKDVAERIREGISSRLGENYNYYNEITNALSRFVSSIDKKHRMSKDGEKIGEKIVKAISRGIKDNWKKIAESIEEAVRRAIDSVSVSSSGTGTSDDDDDDGVSASSVSTGGVDPDPPKPPKRPKLKPKDPDDNVTVSAASVLNSINDLSQIVQEGFLRTYDTIDYISSNSPFAEEKNMIINIHIENVVADNPKKAKELAELISREIAKRTRLSYGAR